jgi:hypothetical protein
MVLDVQRIPKPSLLSLVRGIIDDAKQLVIGQYEFRKYQTLRQIAKAKTKAIWIGTGIAFAGIGAILITLMLVHLLHAIFNLRRAEDSYMEEKINCENLRPRIGLNGNVAWIQKNKDLETA